MSSFGAAVRKSLGRFERPVSDLYRGIFIDLEDLAANIRGWSQPRNILEIGCGEGALAELVVRDFPDANFAFFAWCRILRGNFLYGLG